LYNKTDSSTYKTYKKVESSGDYYIVQNENGEYGVITIGEDITQVFDEKFKSIKYNAGDGNFVVSEKNVSYVADASGNKLTSDYTAEIVEYNDKFIVTKSGNEYHVFNYNNREYLTEYYNGKRIFIELVGNYVGVITNNYEYQVFDFTYATRLLGSVKLDEGNTTTRSRIVDNKIEIYDGDAVLKTIDL
ncbi:MAG: hypothetical protein J5634_00005, partial [Bacilli bacterium]|nr:hypothetical protein [Bacilli bacterium]